MEVVGRKCFGGGTGGSRVLLAFKDVICTTDDVAEEEAEEEEEVCERKGRSGKPKEIRNGRRHPSADEGSQGF